MVADKGRGGRVRASGANSGFIRAAAAVILCAMVLVWAPPASAAPACPDPTTIVQPDGSTAVAYLGGDEFFNWVSVDNRLVQQGADGFWRYLVQAKDQIGVGTARVGLDPAPANAVNAADVRALRPALKQLTGGNDLPVPNVGAAPSSPTEPMLIILVQFTDCTLTTTDAEWSAKMFSTSGKTVRTYFDQVSRNSFHFVPAAESSGTANDGIVRVTLNYAHPNTGSNTDDRNRQIVSDALAAANPFVNFAAFDANSSGSISVNELHVVTIIAGYERSYSSAYTPNVWGHRWSLWGTVPPPTLDGVSVCDGYAGGGYTQQGELHGDHAATIGILCHELGHDIGSPDLYDTDGTSEGVGAYCLMGSGNWGRAATDISNYSGATPTLMCAWVRRLMNFLTYTPLTTNGTYSAVEASNPSTGNCFRINTADSNQYFLVENRQLSGFDAGFYRYFSATAGGAGGGGILIWHIDDSMSNNTNEAHKKVDVEEANQGAVGYSELDTKTNRGNRNHLYFSGNVTAFNAATTPNSNLYSGAATNIGIANVSASGATMTFDVTGLADATSTTTSTTSTSTSTTTTSSTTTTTLGAYPDIRVGPTSFTYNLNVLTSPEAAPADEPPVPSGGGEIACKIIGGRPPIGHREPAAALPDVMIAGVANVLTNVPAFDWSYGCSATSAAMMAGYYDRTGYPNMYTGPANGGVCPLNNSTWGAGECPLSATHLGIDGRVARGHVDDYWISYGSSATDPFIANGWAQHVWGEGTADFMGTNQSVYGSSDGSTSFYYYTNGSPLNDYDAGSNAIDGCYGLRRFFESRGYCVTANFTQLIYSASAPYGCTFAQYKAEIDAGRPVLIHVEGHTMLGFGYDDSTQTLYIHDTWDYLDHTMIWGGSYSGMAHWGVTIIRLAPANSTTRAGVFNILEDAGYALTVNSITKSKSWLTLATPATPFTVKARGQRAMIFRIDSTLVAANDSDTVNITSNDPDESPYPGGVLINVLKTTATTTTTITTTSTTTTRSTSTTTRSTSTTTTTLPGVQAIIDNADTAAEKKWEVLTGTWNTGTSLTDKYGADYRYASTSTAETARSRFSTTLLPAGTYQVYAWWCAYSTRSTSAPYVIKNGATELATVRVNQTVNGGTWNLLGTFAFNAAGHGVELHNGQTTGTGSNVCADAVKFVKVGDVVPTTTLPAITTTTAAPATTTTAAVTTTTLLTLIIDNSDTAADKKFQTTLGTWGTGTSLTDKYGADYRTCTSVTGTATCRANWSTTLLPDGAYQVYAWWAQYSTRSTTVPYVVNGFTITVDQTVNGGTWNLLGTFSFAAGTHLVEIHNAATGTSKSICADAVKFVKVGDPVTTTTLPAITTTTAAPATTTTAAVTTTTLLTLIIDNADTAAEKKFQTTLGTWGTGTSLTDKYGADYRTCTSVTGTATCRANWSTTLLPDGAYQVYAWWAQYSTRSTTVPYVVNGFTITVDQTVNGGTWNLLGTFSFAAGTHLVEIHNAATGTSKSICADAVKFVKVGDPVTTTTLPAITTTTAAPATTTTAAVTTTTLLTLIIDNSDTAAEKKFQTTLGTWGTGTSLTDKYGADYRTCTSVTGTATCRANWSTTLLPTGNYEVYAWWAQYSTRSTTVPYVINGVTVIVDQTVNGGRWNLLGTFAFSGGGTAMVEIHNGATGTSKSICADAVRFVQVGGSATTTTLPAITTTTAPASTTTRSTTTTTQAVTTTTLPGLTEAIVDNSDSAAPKMFQVLSGTWSTGTSLEKYGADYRYTPSTTGGATASARWSCTNLQAGAYQVRVYWQQHTNRSTTVPYTIKNGATVLGTVTVNQQNSAGTAADPSTWYLLGTWSFSAGGHALEISNAATGSNLNVGADAVRFVKVGP